MKLNKSDIISIILAFITIPIANKLGWDKFMFAVIGIFLIGLIYRVYTMNRNKD